MQTFSFKDAVLELIRLGQLEEGTPTHYATSVDKEDQILHGFWLPDATLASPLYDATQYNRSTKHFWVNGLDLQDTFIIKTFAS